MCKINEVIANWLCKWVPKEKKDKTKMKKLTCPRVNVFKMLKGKIVTMDQEKGLKIS